MYSHTLTLLLLLLPTTTTTTNNNNDNNNNGNEHNHNNTNNNIIQLLQHNIHQLTRAKPANMKGRPWRKRVLREISQTSSSLIN